VTKDEFIYEMNSGVDDTMLNGEELLALEKTIIKMQSDTLGYNFDFDLDVYGRMSL
jgi:hypothetical protein